jgi:lipoprotein-releasing system permease protein
MKIGPGIFIASRSLFGRKNTQKTKNAKNALGKPSGGMMGAVISIGISLVPLILVLMVSDGMIQGITRRYIETKTYHIQVTLPDRLERGKALVGLNEINTIEGIRTGFLERSGAAVAVTGSKSHTIQLRAIDDSFFLEQGTAKYLEVIDGDAFPASNRSIVIGVSLAESLGVTVGDSITVITPDKDDSATAMGLPGYSPKLSFFTVKGIVSAGYRDLDAVWAFITPEVGDRILQYPSSSFFMGLKVDDPYSNTIGKISNSVGLSLLTIFPEWFDMYLVRTWPEIESSLYASFGTTKAMLLVIMAITLIIASINLGSALSTFVTEHAMDIAILRSAGASDALIWRIFVGAGCATGTLGTFLGVMTGLLVSININSIIRLIERAVNICDSFRAQINGQVAIPLSLLDPGYYLETIPIVVDVSQIGLITFLSIALSIMVSFLPSRQAVRISVQELIRKS